MTSPKPVTLAEMIAEISDQLPMVEGTDDPIFLTQEMARAILANLEAQQDDGK